MELERGQVAVVTGGSSGIGLALAHAFADRGLDLVLADITEARLAGAVAELEKTGAAVVGVRTDVRAADDVAALATATLERFGRVDVICNNAGVVAAGTPMWEVPIEEWDWTLDVNLRGVINGIRTFVPHLVAQERGHVVNTASMAGLLPQPFAGPYTAAKRAVVGISESLALELERIAPAVGVTVICPGVVDTDILSSGKDAPAEKRIAELHRNIADPDVEHVTGGAVIPPAAVAAAALDAIEHNRLHTAPNGSPVGVREWADRLVADMEQT